MKTVSLSGVTSGNSSEIQPLVLTALSSNPLLIPLPVIFYLSPNTTGALSFTPLVNAWGTATVTVTVNDGQLLNNLVSKSFTVIVNNPPTLNPLSNLAINQDASMQTLSLTGISSGAANETQTLQITATSSNPALIPTPSIFYASPNPSGALTFKPAVGQAGSATISVTVNDGQAGNNTIVRTFTVTVNPVATNIAPTLNALGNFVIAQNSATISVPLSGITSGSSSEVQPLTVTATSSNPTVIPNPTISYASPNATGTLSFAPVANTSGTATITVTVSDGQSLNGTASRTFVVTVNNPPTLNPLSNLSISQDAPMQTVFARGHKFGCGKRIAGFASFGDIEQPGAHSDALDRLYSPTATGALTFKPTAGATEVQ
jgi:hypothetical protein